MFFGGFYHLGNFSPRLGAGIFREKNGYVIISRAMGRMRNHLVFRLGQVGLGWQLWFLLLPIILFAQAYL
jgi:hypothetical protein